MAKASNNMVPDAIRKRIPLKAKGGISARANFTTEKFTPHNTATNRRNPSAQLNPQFCLPSLEPDTGQFYRESKPVASLCPVWSRMWFGEAVCRCTWEFRPRLSDSGTPDPRNSGVHASRSQRLEDSLQSSHPGGSSHIHGEFLRREMNLFESLHDYLLEL